MMAKDNSFELMPYFMWKINDMSMKSESPIFSVGDVKFRMIYHRSERTSALFMIPEVGDQQPFVPSYDIKTSASIIDPDKSFEYLYFIKRKTNQNSSGRKMNHLIWEMENKIFETLDMIQEENGIKNVTFLCVFGPFCEYRNDVTNVDDPWREYHCMESLGKDLNNLRLKEDSTIELKCGDKTLKAHKVILSARSETFDDMFRNGKEVEIDDMEFEVLENLIIYIYSGRLQESIPSAELLRKLYNAAHKYKVESLKSMTIVRLTEILVSTEVFIKKEVLDKEKLPSGQEEVLDKEKLPSGQEEVLDKEKLPSGSYTMDQESLTKLALDLLKEAHVYKDEKFKQSIIHSIVHNNDFILNEKAWLDFRSTDQELAMEVYDVLVNDLL